MVHYYIDIELASQGSRPEASDQIVAVLLCAINPETGMRVQDPILFTGDEMTERELVEALAQRIVGKDPFDFVAVGFNVLFDMWLLRHKFSQYGIADLDDRFFLERPMLDLKHVGVLANKGVFKGVRLGAEGNPVRAWHEAKNWEAIEQYLLDKMEHFLQAYRLWSKKLRA